MRKIGDIMTELGFNKDSSTETQKAFVKHLIKAAYGVEVRDHKDVIPHQKPNPWPVSRQDATKVVANPQAQRHDKRPAKEADKQLSFDFDKKEESA